MFRAALPWARGFMVEVDKAQIDQSNFCHILRLQLCMALGVKYCQRQMRQLSPRRLFYDLTKTALLQLGANHTFAM